MKELIRLVNAAMPSLAPMSPASPTKDVPDDETRKRMEKRDNEKKDAVRSGRLTSSFTFAKPERHYDVEALRGNTSGYIGGANVARKASDDELILIAQLKDEAAGFANHAKEFSDRAESIMKDIERRKG